MCVWLISMRGWGVSLLHGCKTFANLISLRPSTKLGTTGPERGGKGFLHVLHTQLHNVLVWGVG